MAYPCMDQLTINGGQHHDKSMPQEGLPTQSPVHVHQDTKTDRD
jgi:hypothetical protein